jgi:hypothetical protein
MLVRRSGIRWRGGKVVTPLWPPGKQEAQIRRGDIFAQATVEGGEDGVAHGFSLLQDVFVPEAHDGIALRGQECVATAVMGAVGVLGAIDLDDEHALATGEVSEVRADGQLTDKLIAPELPSLQFQPEQTFGGVLLPSQGACAFSGARLAATA